VYVRRTFNGNFLGRELYLYRQRVKRKVKKEREREREREDSRVVNRDARFTPEKQGAWGRKREGDLRIGSNIWFTRSQYDGKSSVQRAVICRIFHEQAFRESFPAPSRV